MRRKSRKTGKATGEGKSREKQWGEQGKADMEKEGGKEKQRKNSNVKDGKRKKKM